MRHRKAGVHLSRTPAHRRALFSNLVAALFEYEEIKTTQVKARATAPNRGAHHHSRSASAGRAREGC
jgi:ribosomal protein L17